VAAPQSVGLGRRAASRFSSPAPCAAHCEPAVRCEVGRPPQVGRYCWENICATSSRRLGTPAFSELVVGWSWTAARVSLSTRHQLDAVAVVLIPPRALASPATRAPRRPGSATWRHLIERLIPITVIGAVLLAGSATAASGLDWPRAEVRHGVRARAVRDGRHRAQPCERSGAARCGPVDVAVSASAEWCDAVVVGKAAPAQLVRVANAVQDRTGVGSARS